MADIEVGTSGTSVKASMSDRIIVRLPENGSTGYQWAITEVTEPLEVESSEFLSPGELAPGAAGARVVVVRPRGPGRARMALQLRRAWEPEPLEHFDVEVDVADP